jgi:Tfp pilus assembly PilM family ATPase
MREKTAEKSKTTEVVFAAADSTSAEVLSKVCQIAKLTPRAMDLSAAATMRAYTRVAEDDQSAALIVDIGHTATVVTARYGPSLVYIDTIPNFGGNFLTRTVQQSMGVDFYEAEKRKTALQLVDVSAAWGQTYEDRYGTGEVPLAQRESAEELTNRDLSDAADQMIEHISNSVNTALGYLPNNTAQSLFLVGGTSQMTGLPDRIEAMLGIRVQRAMPWAEIEASKRNLEFFIDRSPSEANQDPSVLTAFATHRACPVEKHHDHRPAKVFSDRQVGMKKVRPAGGSSI